MRNIIYLLVILVSIVSCTQKNDSKEYEIDSLLVAAHKIRYTSIDSVEAKLHKAEILCGDANTEKRAQIMGLRAFVRFEQMDYDGAIRLTDSIYGVSKNQVTLLEADIIRMKVCQRISDGRSYYEANSRAVHRFSRINQELDALDRIDLQIYRQMQTDYHFIASTYYYYQDQDSLSINEMRLAEACLQESPDTIQQLYFDYMIGSGGMVTDTYEKVAQREFEYLLRCYLTARRIDVHYFQANALQALAERMATPRDRFIIRAFAPEAYNLLLSQHLSWMPDSTESWVQQCSSEELLPIALARHALHAFADYGDMYQMACTYRTLGQLQISSGRYELALDAFADALTLINRQHVSYYNCKGDTLQLYDPNDTSVISTERRWIEDNNIQSIPECIASIRQQISIAFSGLDYKQASDYNRNIYLDILESTSQNREMESRKVELEHENTVQHRLLFGALALFVVVIVLVVLIVMRMRMHDIRSLQIINRNQARILRDDKQRVEQLHEKLEELREQCEMSRMHIAQYKSQNAERRAKVSLVQAVVPFLDRIINEVSRLNRSAKPQPNQLEYIVELSDQIVSYNSILTEWIKMHQGDLSLHISSFSLESLFDIIQQGHYSFDQQNVQLEVVPTTAHVKADEALTMFMLNTLADNARKFTPAGGKVTLEAIEAEDYVELSVTDTGCGMKQDDVETILGNKVYDASKIGSQQQQKGFGFGLMNCKGIIEKYRKSAKIFNVCTFGIDSKLGQGSRIYFRLPRVLTVIISMMILSLNINAKSNYYDLLYNANIDGRYEDAICYADSALYEIDHSLVVYDSENHQTSQTSDIRGFNSGRPWDFSLIIAIRNEIAVAALALHQWDVYDYNNRICVNLHKLYNQDTSLPSYCDLLTRTQSHSRQTTALLVMLTVVVLVLSFVMFRGKRKLAQKLATQLNDEVTETEDVLSRLRYEENRLYVQNQVLDNCLSTIKHESMYYPSRIRQLAERMLDKEDTADDLSQLTELTSYYKKLYTLLGTQAERQVAQVSFRRERLTINYLLGESRSIFNSVKRQLRASATLSVDSGGIDVKQIVRADSTLIEELFRQLFSYALHESPESDFRLSFSERDGQCCVRLSSSSFNYSDESAHNLFYPSLQRISLFIVRQIVRDIDEMNNNPGLRLVAEKDSIWFTLK